MKLKHLLLSFTLLLFIFSCSNTEKKESAEASKTTDKKEEAVHSSTHEPKIDNSPLVYKVSLGVLPDLTYEGVGVRAAKVHKDRPGYNGGMQDNDIVIEIDGIPVQNLVEYTKVLGGHKKDDTVVLTLKRGDKTLKANIKFD